MTILGLNSPEIFLLLTITLIILGPRRIEKGLNLFSKVLKFLLSDLIINDNSTDKVQMKDSNSNELRESQDKPIIKESDSLELDKISTMEKRAYKEVNKVSTIEETDSMKVDELLTLKVPNSRATDKVPTIKAPYSEEVLNFKEPDSRDPEKIPTKQGPGSKEVDKVLKAKKSNLKRVDKSTAIKKTDMKKNR